MPYEWIPPQGPDAPQQELHLWPYRSLLRRDFVTFISLTALLVLVPLLAVIGSPVLWALLPFILGMLWAIWWALERSYRDGEILEELCIWSDRMTLDHHSKKKGHKTWEANPYWVQVKINRDDPRIKNYLTLKGNNREVELGAFLSEDERADLFDEIQDRLRKLT